MHFTRYVSWVVLVLALIAWGLIGYFAWTIHTGGRDRAANAQIAEQSSTQEASALRMHAIAQDTVQEREQLATLVAIDVVTAAGQIEAVGKASGIEVKLGNALPENASTAQGNARVQSVGFTIEAQGKFAALMHAAQLLETLPIPSSLGRLDIERVPGTTPSTAPLWHMNAYIRVLTTSDVSP